MFETTKQVVKLLVEHPNVNGKHVAPKLSRTEFGLVSLGSLGGLALRHGTVLDE